MASIVRYCGLEPLERRWWQKKLWRTVGDLIGHCPVLGVTFVVKSGYVTDLASIPWLFTWLYPKDGSYKYSAIPHDWLYETHGLLTVLSENGGYEMMELEKEEADKLFLRLMRGERVPERRRNLFFTMVDKFGSYDKKKISEKLRRMSFKGEG